MKQYEFIISNKKFSINNENDLEVLFKIFSGNSKTSSVIHWNILMEVDSDLEKIITSYRGLLNCLKYLNEKNSFLFLVKLGDVLINLISNSKELAEIISRIPEESNKIKLLSILRLKGLTKILYDAKDLGNIFEWLYGKSQRDFINLLGKDIIKKLFFSTNEIIMTLHYLTDENKDYLMDILGLDGVKAKVKTSKDFLVMFKGLTIKKSKILLKKFTKSEILDMFKTEDDFYKFLLRLPRDKEKIFLEFLQK
ncbi:MAG: hypothetical protein PHE25_02350 [Candidatus Gracilibacteria bacterium]|nr:hypothetical protein [Candidatus Gracilibacteria bacterium]